MFYTYYYRLTTSKIVDYLQKELRFIDRNYNFPVSVFRKASFFKHILYWQGLFKLYRSIDVSLKADKNLPFYVHKDKIEIEITTNCSMRCFHCDRSCRQAPSDECMTVDQIQNFIDESIKANRKWPFIVLIGGEPTMHPDIYEIVDLLIDYKRNHSPNTKLTISTNGVTDKTKEILANLPEIIHQENSSKASNANARFCAFNLAPIDSAEYKNSKPDFSIGCQTVSTAGTALTRYGYYACGAAASVDRVSGFDIGIKKLEDISEKKYRKQMGLLCGYCGLFGTKIMDASDLESVSPTWQKLYAEYKTQKPELTLYGDAVSETKNDLSTIT